MKIPRRIRRRAKLIIASLAAAITAHVMAFGMPAQGEEMCSLHDVTDYQNALAHPSEEATPDYILRVAETFLNKCPDRLEVREIHLVAARAALDNGQASLSAMHYQKAINAGAKLSPAARMDHAVALLATGNDAQARAARNLAVFDWLTQLDAKGVTALTVSRAKGGLIYGAYLPATEQDQSVQAAWLAVPHGPELPSAAIIYRDDVRAAWMSVRRETAVETLMSLAHRTCDRREILMDAADTDLPTGVEAQAIDTLKAYLEAPHRVSKTAAGHPIASCLGLDQMFYVPATAVTALPDKAG